MSNKNKRSGNEGQQVIDKDGKPIDIDPGNMPNPGDGVDNEPKGLTGFFVRVIRGGKKVWSKTPKPLKVAAGTALTAGALYAAGKAGYSFAEKHYKPLIPTADDGDEETGESFSSDDDLSLEDQGYQRFDVEGTTVYTDDPHDDPQVIEQLSNSPEE